MGASTNKFGVKGVKEYCLFMKQISDAVLFRQRLGFAFEQASLLGLTDAERTQLLTFVVIGSGPTGVELCGELRDFVAQDARDYTRSWRPLCASCFSHRPTKCSRALTVTCRTPHSTC